MEDMHEGFMPAEESSDGEQLLLPPPSFQPPFRSSTRLPVQRSSVCSRAYFVVVMVFFHVYILNVIALLLYVHYNNGPGELVGAAAAAAAARDSQPTSASSSSPAAEGGASLPRPDPPSGELHAEEYTQSFSLPRIEGIRVGHVQPVSLVGDRTHEMKTLSLKPLLFVL